MPPQDIELQSYPSAIGSEHDQSNRKTKRNKSSSKKKSSNKKSSNIYSEFDNIQEGGESEDDQSNPQSLSSNNMGKNDENQQTSGFFGATDKNIMRDENKHLFDIAHG